MTSVTLHNKHGESWCCPYKNGGPRLSFSRYLNIHNIFLLLLQFLLLPLLIKVILKFVLSSRLFLKEEISVLC